MKMRCKYALAAAMLIGFSGSLSADEIVRYNLAGQPGTQLSNAPESTAANITGDISLTRSAGGIVPSVGNNSMASNTWSVGQYYSFGFTVNAGYQVDLTNLQIGTRSSSTGPKYMVLYCSVDSFTTPIATITHPSVVAFVNSDIDLSSLTGLTGSIEFRLRVDEDKKALDETPIASTGTNRITNFFQPADPPTDPPTNVDSGGFRINGTVSPVGAAPELVNARPYHNSFPEAEKVDNGVSLIQRGVNPQTAELVNIISSSQGINGVVLDFDNLANLGDISLEYKMSPQNVFATPIEDWVDAPAPASATLLPDAGQAGSDRVLVTWTDNSIQNRYLCIRVIYNGSTVFELYLGHLKGEMTNGNGSTFSVSYAADLQPIRLAVGTQPGASGRPDVDKNNQVQLADIVAMRTNAAAQLTQLLVPGSPPES